MAQDTPSAVVDIPIDGNKTVTIALPNRVNNMVIQFYRFSVVGNGYTWMLTNVSPGQGSARDGTTNPLDLLQDLSLTVTTAGLPVTGPAATTSQYIDFVPCTNSLNVQCFPVNARRYRFVVDPALTISPTATITADGSSARQVQLVWPTPLANSPVTAACVKDSGAPASTTITVSPASRNTSADGRADFTITTSGLRLIATSGNPPSGRCTFRAHGSSTKTAVVEVLGQRIAPTLDVSPSSVSVPTSAETFVDRVVTVDTRPSAYGNVTIDADCSAEAPATVALDGGAQGATQTGSKATNASGEVTFRVRAENLVTLPPTGSPHVRCRFKVHELTATYEYFVSGRQIAPSVSVSPGTITQPGTTAVTATMSPAYPGFDIVPSCTVQNLLPVSATETSATTNASGQQTFSVSAPELVITNASGVQPSAWCQFRAGGVGFAGLLSFTTGNTCAMTLSPLPPGCGNPN
ncbi:MAG: hypothetical protein AMXMBFR59_06450 [Rhodanobacteraceae bacterium]